MLERKSALPNSRLGLFMTGARINIPADRAETLQRRSKRGGLTEMLKNSLFLGAFLALGSFAQAAEPGDWITTWAASPQPIGGPDFFAPVKVPRNFWNQTCARTPRSASAASRSVCDLQPLWNDAARTRRRACSARRRQRSHQGRLGSRRTFEANRPPSHPARRRSATPLISERRSALPACVGQPLPPGRSPR